MGQKKLLGSIDQGTSSSRFMVFEANKSKPLVYHQVEVKRICPKEGWVEQDPVELLESTLLCIEKTVEKMKVMGLDPADIGALGVTNQRESVIPWDRITGKALYNSIVWLDSRTSDYVDQFLASPTATEDLAKIKEVSGVRISNYFSALKIKWLLENVDAVKEAVKNDRCLFGTVDSWLLWNYTGGKSGGVHITDVTNASRTMLMNIRTLDWDPFLCSYFNIPEKRLPRIRSSSEIYGYMTGTQLNGIPLASIMGDQQAALVGHKCFKPGLAKCTFGTGCFLLLNTGEQVVNTSASLLATVAYRHGPNKPPIYALEGSAGIAGAALRWLRDNLGIVSSFEELSEIASTVDDSEGVFFVPAFSGLLAPHWRPDARGIICGLTEHSTRAHIAKAAFEATAFQVKDLLEAMNQETSFPLDALVVGGGMTANSRFVQTLADLVGIKTLRPSMSETTALGAAIAAGAAEGIELWDVYSNHEDEAIPCDEFVPSITHEERERRYSKWKIAVQRSFGLDVLTNK